MMLRLGTATSGLLRVTSRLFSTTPTPFAQIKRATTDEQKLLSVEWDGGHKSSFNFWWLRDNCRCPKCVQPTSGQKLFSIADCEPSNPHHVPDRVELVGDGSSLRISWDATHDSLFDSNFLEQHCIKLRSEKRQKQRPHLWEAKDFETFKRTSHGQVFVNHHLPSVQYDDVMQSDQGLYEWCQLLNKYGIAIVKNVPPKDQEVMRVAGRIAYPRETIYGRMFDVVSTTRPINVAYTPLPLRLHMDLMYYEAPPGIQMLHCLEAQAEGGENSFADSFNIAESMKQNEPEMFKVLSEIPITYHKQHEAHRMFFRRPLFTVDDKQNLQGVHYSPQFEGPLEAPPDQMTLFYQAYKTFVKRLESSQYRVRFLMESGDMISFNNRRVTHARDAFDTRTGPRHLQGTYLDHDEFASRLRFLAETIDHKDPLEAVSRLGNASH